ncbi:MAG: exosortase/archaeosortase family protein [Gammaproteobacteria bacterium]|nr:exosortase/archaeosortase family protein [Gammaproteobacteria bacterium]
MIPFQNLSKFDTSLKHLTQSWLVGLILLLFFLVFAPTMYWLWERWTMSVWSNGHGIVVTLAIAFLVREELKHNSHLPLDPTPLGFMILIPALLLHMLDTGIHSQLLSAFALILSLPGFSLLFLGKSKTKTILFLLLALFLTIPIPLAFTESIHLALRYIATDSTVWLLRLFDIPVYAKDTTIQIENGSLQVADACSGFATLYATVTVALLTAYLCRNTPRRIIVLAIAAPLAISVNIVRVFILTLLVKWFGLDVLNTSAHEISGLFTFMVALPIIFIIGRDQNLDAHQHNLEKL